MKRADYTELLKGLDLYSKHEIDPDTLPDKNNLPDDVIKEPTTSVYTENSQQSSQYNAAPKKSLYKYYKLDLGDLSESEILTVICAKQANFIKTIKNIMVFFCILVVIELVCNLYLAFVFAQYF